MATRQVESTHERRARSSDSRIRTLRGLRAQARTRCRAPMACPREPTRRRPQQRSGHRYGGDRSRRAEPDQETFSSRSRHLCREDELMANQDPIQDPQDRNVEVPGDTDSADIVGRTGEQMPRQSHDGLEDQRRSRRAQHERERRRPRAAFARQRHVRQESRQPANRPHLGLVNERPRRRPSAADAAAERLRP